MKIKELKLNEKNPRSITNAKMEKLQNSIKDFPQMMSLRPIVVDEQNVILGGNMRYQALRKMYGDDYDLPKEWVVKAGDLNEEQKKEFVIKDNVGFGEWDFDLLLEEWSVDDLENWGVDLPDEVKATSENFGDEFSLPNGDKLAFKQMTFTLSNEQAEIIESALKEAKNLEEYKYIETFGNTNTNGNALYLILTQWEDARK